MGETARERFYRMQQERAGEKSTSSGEATPAAAKSTGLPALIRERQEAKRRQEATADRRNKLMDRMRALSCPVESWELPETDAELADLERFCAEQESAAK